jgi:hypothetical protein
MVKFAELAAQLRAQFFNVRETRPNSHIYLLLDNDFPVATDHPLHPEQLKSRPAKRARAVVGTKESAAPLDWQPNLLQLYCSGERGYEDEQLIDISLEIALERCTSINGAFLAAWIASDLAPAKLAATIYANGEVFDLHVGRRHRLALYQPYRMALLLGDTGAQKFLDAYLKHIYFWGFVDAAGTLQTVTKTDIGAEPSVPAITRPHLPSAQGQMQSRVNLARLVLLGINKAGHILPPKAEIVIDGWIVQAQKHGLTHAEDVLFYALNCLSLSPHWHSHPQAKGMIASSRAEGLSLAGLFAEQSDELLDEIAAYQPKT